MRWLLLLLVIATAHCAYLDHASTKATWELSLNGTLDTTGVTNMRSSLHFDRDPPSNQKIRSIDPSSDADISYSNGSYIYWWHDKSGTKTYALSFTATIEEIIGKDTGSSENLHHSGFIDTSEKLQNLALSLKGKTRMRSVYNTVQWIENNIDLSEKGKTRATEVLQAEHGNAFGLTALFLSLTREMGIPSRFVYGLAYDEQNLTNPHSWAEVYIDGWMPVDIKYQQIGVIDVSHIKLYDSKTLNNKIVDHSADGKEIDIPNMDFTATLISQDRSEPPVDVKINPYIRIMGPDSYNLLEVIITNPLDQPVTAVLDLPLDGIKIIEQPDNFVYIPPGETQLHYIIQNTIPLDRMPYVINDKEKGRHVLLRNPLELDMRATEDGKVLSLEQVRNIGEPHIIEEPQNPKSTITGNITEVNLDHLLDQFNKTSEVIDVKKVITYDNKTNTTSVFINITPRKKLGNVSVYEEIPKCLTEIIQNVQPGEVDFEVVNPDPLIVWNFDEVNDSITISYDVLKTLRNISCEDETATMTVAQKIGADIGEEKNGYMVYLIIFLIMAGLVSLLVIYRKITNV
ncbi:MAG: transglutaminase domain-containing protein [Candidatus Woesearchaeota archaeon]